MADLTKRARKRLGEFLEPDETIEVAVLCEPRGTYGPGMIGLTLATRTTDRHLAAKAAGSRTGMASTLPSSSFILAITDARVLMSRSNGLTFAAPEPVFRHDEVFAGDLRNHGIGRRLTLVFVDGSATDVDLQRGQPIGRLVERLGAPPAAPLSS